MLGSAGGFRSHSPSSMAHATTATAPAKIHPTERVFEFATGSECNVSPKTCVQSNFLRARGGAPLLISAAEEVSYRGIGGRQCFFVRQEDDTKMLGAGLLAEAGAVDDHHVLLQNELLHKHIVAFGNVDARKRVECAARRNTTYTRGRIAPLHG